MLKYLEMAGETANIKKDKRGFRVGAVAIRNDGVVVKASNGPSDTRMGNIHAEARLMRKAGFGSTVFVARIAKGTKKLAMARPCKRCQSIMKAYRVAKVYYSINENEYGIMYPLNIGDSDGETD